MNYPFPQTCVQRRQTQTGKDMANIDQTKKYNAFFTSNCFSLALPFLFSYFTLYELNPVVFGTLCYIWGPPKKGDGKFINARHKQILLSVFRESYGWREPACKRFIRHRNVVKIL